MLVLIIRWNVSVQYIFNHYLRKKHVLVQTLHRQITQYERIKAKNMIGTSRVITHLHPLGYKWRVSLNISELLMNWNKLQFICLWTLFPVATTTTCTSEETMRKEESKELCLDSVHSRAYPSPPRAQWGMLTTDRHPGQRSLQCLTVEHRLDAGSIC